MDKQEAKEFAEVTDAMVRSIIDAFSLNAPALADGLCLIQERLSYTITQATVTRLKSYEAAGLTREEALALIKEQVYQDHAWKRALATGGKSK